ncbi:MAG: ATP-binding cassette domain-containing protein [Proteobacteria bacterium]|jgi:ABC-type microcin C transport system duplicated ATPase subunit YejF|nr:ATP-binding cassette domain-containing protein [Pseudomonadota bacterium]
MNSPILEIDRLSISFRTEAGTVDAVKNVCLSMNQGESLAVVGESGSGKSVAALSLARLLPWPPAEFSSGRILFEGNDVLKMTEKQLRSIRGRSRRA